MKFNRRNFLKTVGSASFSSVLAGSSESVFSATRLPVDASAFDFQDDKVPMNAANLCPMHPLVSRGISDLQRSLDLDMSDANRDRIEAIKGDARGAVAGLLGVDNDNIAFVRNTSEANNVVVQGLPLDAGDEVLLWDQNHPSNSVAWKVRAQRSGCTIRYLSVPAGIESIDEVVSIFENAIGPKTRVVSFTHISNISGFRLPAQEICSAIRNKADVHIHVDGAQTWGAADFDLARVGCDTFTGSAHKWFMGPREVGLLYANERSIERIWASVVSVPWGDNAETSATGARKFEAMGQRDDAAIAGLLPAAKIHENSSPAEIERQSMHISNRLREGLTDIGAPFVSPLNPEFTSSVVILQAEYENAKIMTKNVLRDGGIITAATGGFRMSPHVYNTEDHIDRVVAAVAKSRDLLKPG